jgi:hypothetical protein
LLQIGNFQLTALSLGILAMLAFARERPVLGGLALGFATLSKIVPGVLGLWLLATRAEDTPRADGFTVCGAGILPRGR